MALKGIKVEVWSNDDNRHWLVATDSSDGIILYRSISAQQAREYIRAGADEVETDEYGPPGQTLA